MARFYSEKRQQWAYRNAWGIRPERPEDCIAEVDPAGVEGIGSNHQCSRKRGHGTDGAFCRQHAKLNETK